MTVKKTQYSKLFLAVLATIPVPGCSGAPAGKSIPQEPFTFEEVRALARPIASIRPETRDAVSAEMREKAPRISDIYSESLTRFENIYGSGVGPAKNLPEYLACKVALHRVHIWISTVPVQDDITKLSPLWSELVRCHRAAISWSDPAEIATFGKDLKAMTEGGMLVLSYAATASKIGAGTKLYTEVAASEAQESPENGH